MYLTQVQLITKSYYETDSLEENKGLHCIVSFLSFAVQQRVNFYRVQH